MSKASTVLKDMQEVRVTALTVIKAVENGIRKWTEIKEYGVNDLEMWIETKDGSRFIIVVSKAK